MLLILLILLIEAVLEFKPHLGRKLEFVCKNRNERNRPLIAPVTSSVGRRNSIGVDEERKGSSLVAIKMKAHTVVEKGDKSLFSDPGSEIYD